MILEVDGKQVETDMTISEEDIGWLFTGIPGWHCPVLFQVEFQEADELGPSGVTLHDPRAIVRDDEYGFDVPVEQFEQFNLSKVILEHIESD
jgi:hypothetical protein